MNARTYTAPLSDFVDADTIEALRGYGAVGLTFEYGADAAMRRSQVIRELGDEYESWSFGRDFWEDNLSRRRGNTYTAPLPDRLDEETVDSLRGLGAVHFMFEIKAEWLDAETRAQLVRALGEEFGWRGLDVAFWDERLSGRRKRAGE